MFLYLNLKEIHRNHVSMILTKKDESLVLGLKVSK